ncbi:MAG TPA: tetratricopeptide repeat protein [Candidatus Krumholzibacteria bacterium]|nr:tetratricopeptide repeat protein [Candidatus Krumholzibacteria bacterium]
MRRMMLAVSLAGMACLAPSFAGAAEGQAALLRDDLAVYHRAVSTKSQEAQKYFDQGLVLHYGFNHEAAIASFQRAGELDPALAIAWWGQAISAGPNINNPQMDDEAAQAAYQAAQHALTLLDKASPVEQDLIRAVAARYAWPQPEDRRALDVAYADEMRKVWQAHPKDADVGAMFADAVMNLLPWDLWSPQGEPRKETPEIITTLKAVLAMDRNHPMANHLYIHTMEASLTPDKALPSADILRDRVPGAGHLLHMPAHIDIRLGHYSDAMLANQKAIEIDRTWAAQGGFYTLYRAHNFHFLAYAAMFDGQREIALKAAREMLVQIPLEIVREFPDFLDGFVAVPTHVMVRFGLWEELLNEPAPPADLVVTTAFWHYGRTVAFAALGRAEEATQEFDVLKSAVAAVPESRLIGNNTALTVLDVGLPMAEGELEYRRGNHDRAFELLRSAVARDVALKYDEPWGWMMPVAHSLGALLVEQGRYEEAEAVYRDDLELHPSNGWALHGLAECLRKTGRADEAAKVDERFKSAWSRADIAIEASCYCRRSAN